MYIIQNVYKVPRRYYVFVFVNIFALALKQQIEMNYFGTTEENHQTPMWFSSVSVTAADQDMGQMWRTPHTQKRFSWWGFAKHEDRTL